ncbi:MAG: SnoaL-like domain [Acidobacteriota bacterium]|jgi:ketosteroid isomerase-like protein|nr:SnoaL-like domain [Acidobacteriota bacterium]
MFRRLSIIIMVTCALSAYGFAQNSNSSSATRKRTSTAPTKTTNTPAKGVEEAGAQQTEETPSTRTPSARSKIAGSKNVPTAKDVLATFNTLLEGIRHTDVSAVTGVYWNSPQLVLFNNNGSVTKGWEQMRTNRASSYPNMKDVKLDVRDVRVQMLGRDGAVVTCLWTQSQTYKGASETATGRMTLVFRRIGTTWKAVHLHTSPDSPDQSRVLPSEQATPTPTPRPKATP